MLNLVVAFFTSTLVSGLVAFFLNMYKEERVLRLKKLEEFYLVYTGFITTISCQGVYYKQCLSKKIDLNDVYDKIIESKDDAKDDFKQMNLCAAIYFPGLIPIVDELISCRDEYSNSTNEFSLMYKNGVKDFDNIYDRLVDVMRMLDRLESGLRDHVVAEREKINRPWKGFFYWKYFSKSRYLDKLPS